MLWTIMHAYAEQLFWISNADVWIFCIVKSYAGFLSISLTARTCKHSDKMLSKMYHALLLKTNSVYGSIFQLHIEVNRTISYPCIFTHYTCTHEQFYII